MANNIPALTSTYGRSSYWDELNQKRTQGYSPSDKQLTALAYGERYGELANEMNRQKLNRQLALDEYKATSDVGYKNRLLDINADTANKQWYGQLGGLGIAALMNWDKLARGMTNIGGNVKDLYNYFNQPALQDFDPTDYGYNLDQYIDWENLGYDPSQIDQYYGANEVNTWANDTFNFMNF